MKNYRKDQIKSLELLYDKVEYVGNELVIATIYNEGIAIIELDTQKIIYEYNSIYYYIQDNFIDIGEKTTDVISIKSRRSINSSLGIDLSKLDFACLCSKEDVMYISTVEKVETGYRHLKTTIYDYNCNILHKEDNYIDKLKVKNGIIEYDAKPLEAINPKKFGRVYSIRKTICKETGKQIRERKINRLKIFKLKLIKKLGLI